MVEIGMSIKFFFLTIIWAVTEVRRICVRICIKGVIGSDRDRSTQTLTSTCHRNENERETAGGKFKQIDRNSDEA